MRLVVDTSALVAILLDEPERERFRTVLQRSEPVMSIASLAEAYLVVQAKRGTAALGEVDIIVEALAIQLAPVLPEDRAILQGAVRDFARGRRQPPAVLNFGDLFAYALAKRLALPLLFKGSDFTLTDIQAVSDLA